MQKNQVANSNETSCIKNTIIVYRNGESPYATNQDNSGTENIQKNYG